MSESGLSGIERDLSCRGYPVRTLQVTRSGVQKVIADGPQRKMTYFRKAHIIKIDEGPRGTWWLSDVGVHIQE